MQPENKKSKLIKNQGSKLMKIKKGKIENKEDKEIKQQISNKSIQLKMERIKIKMITKTKTNQKLEKSIKIKPRNKNKKSSTNNHNQAIPIYLRHI